MGKVKLTSYIKQKPVFVLDGGFGTNVLKKYPQNFDAIELFNFSDEALVADIHRGYVESGAEMINTNTFSANRFKLKSKGYSVAETVKKAVSLARQSGAKYTALDIGPLGRMLSPLGDMTFDEAYAAFSEIITAGAGAGADLVYFETFSDLMELKIGVLAAKENCKLPIFATMTFEPNNKTFVGVSPAAAAVTMEGLGVTAFGLNCSSGPLAMLPIVEEIAAHVSIPIIAKPNAGIPETENGVCVYKLSVEDYIDGMSKLVDAGARIVGGCCGTEPMHIKALSDMLSDKRIAAVGKAKKTFAASSNRVVSFDDNFVIIGERLNPTGKPSLKKALIDKEWEYLIAEARAQISAGADILDINAGIFEVNETETLSEIVRQFNGIIDAPYCLDSSESRALESAVRYVSGLPVLNSVNGKTSSLNAVMPIAKKYGAPLVCLLLDEGGIPKSVEDRIRIAKKILAYAKKYGIDRSKLIFDCLTLTASAEQENVMNTLEAIKIITKKYKCATVLGLSNVSFGLPLRDKMNSAFLSLAQAYGLTSAILNPLNHDVSAAIDCYRVLKNKDKGAVKYIAKYKGMTTAAVIKRDTPEASPTTDAIAKPSDIEDAIIKGRKEETRKLAVKILETDDGLTLINKYLIPALDRIGAMYEKGTIFLPELLMSASAAKIAFEIVKERSVAAAEKKGTVLLATVFGDVHDIGKNIAKMLLENYGYDVIDLGKDVPIEVILNAIKANNIKLVGLSALMTTTLNNMRETITEIRKISDAAIMAGGAVVTKENSKLIGADFYCKDAIDGVAVARRSLDI